MKQQRIDHFNFWPKAQEFSAEKAFKERVNNIPLEELFFPYQIPSTNDPDIHVCVSYFLDAVDSLPFRPDHAFDWVWRGFEYISGKSFSTNNITNTIRSGVWPEITAYFNSNIGVETEFFKLVNSIPFQTCEYLLKRINDNVPYISGSLSSFAKRMLYENGNPPVVSPALQIVLQFLSSKYNYQITSERRKGASLLRRILRQEQVCLGSSMIQLTKNELLFFMLSGLGYTFRNDRAHAKSIAPFRSSYATIKTYAHCWFMFLLFYEVTFILFHTQASPVIFSGNIAQNYEKNNLAFLTLFGDYINA